MIKSTKSKITDKPKIDFPKLMVSTNYNQLVFFIRPSVGILLDEGRSKSFATQEALGKVDDWIMDYFEDYVGEVTIKNA